MNEQLDFVTETDEGVNISVNQVETNCIVSKNNKFHLDSEGNLTVNSITTKEGNIKDITMDNIYPVGSIYMNINNVNPGTLFGGTWVQLKDRFLLGVGDTYKENQTGGEAIHTLTEAEMPSHAHSMNGVRRYSSNGSFAWIAEGVANKAIEGASTSWTGGSKAHNNMPPYLTVYMFQRIS